MEKLDNIEKDITEKQNNKERIKREYIWKSILCFCLVIALIIYLFKIKNYIQQSVPSPENMAFVSEATSIHSTEYCHKYFIMTSPFLIVYMIFFTVNFKKIKYIRVLNYPLTLIAAFLFCFWFEWLRVGGIILWMLYFILPLLIPGLVFTFGTGISADITENKRKEEK